LFHEGTKGEAIGYIKLLLILNPKINLTENLISNFSNQEENLPHSKNKSAVPSCENG
jgi:hypothetical protein